MPETASAPPLTPFRSSVMVAIERMLSLLAHRVAGPQSEFGARNLSFADRILSRRLETVGPYTAAQSQFTPRAIEPQNWVLPRSWVPSPAELRQQRESALSAPSRRAAQAPTRAPAAAESAPSLPFLPVESAASARAAVAAPAKAAGTELRPGLPPLAAPAAVPQAPAQQVLPTAPSAAVPAAVPPTTAPTAQVLPTAGAAVEQTAGQTATLPVAGAAPPAISKPQEPALEAVLPGAGAAQKAADTAPETLPATALPEELRVRDWLAQSWVTPAPAAVPSAPSAFGRAAAVSPLARAFSHLGWVDQRLGRSTAVEQPAAAPAVAAASAGAGSSTVEPRAVALPAMPMVAAEQFVPGAQRRRPPVPSLSAAAPAVAQPPVSAPPIQKKSAAAAAAPAAELPVVGPAAALPDFSGPLSAAAGTWVQPSASASPSPFAAIAAAAESGQRPVAAALARADRFDLGGLASPLLPSLSAAAQSPTAELAAVQPARRAEPGALAAHFERFAAAKLGRTYAVAPSASTASALREWAGAPGLSMPVSALLGRAFDREGSYTPARWQEAAAPRPYPPLPTVAAPSAAPSRRAPSPLRGASLDLAPVPAAPSPSAAALPPVASAAPAARPALEPLAAAAQPAQPWREAGGAATLAELFAAGIGLGSGATSTLAQRFGAPRAAGLVPEWLQPLLASPRPPQPPDGIFPELGRPASAGERPWAVSAPSVERETTRADAAPGLPRRFQGAPEGLPFTTAIPSSAYFQAGAIGLRTQLYAAAQGVRIAGAERPSPTDLRQWMRAPGLSEALSRAMAKDAAPAPDDPPTRLPARFFATGAAGQLPYLGLPAPEKAGPSQRVREQPAAVAAKASVTSQAPGAVAPMAPAPGPESSPSARAFELAEQRPWLAPGGAAALAELFAAGVGLGSGSAGWLAESAAPAHRRGGLVADWLRPLLKEPASTQPGSEPAGAARDWRRLPMAAAPLSYVGWERPAPAAAAAGRTPPAGAPRVPAQPDLRQSQRTWPTAGQLGELSAEAERFAAVHGLQSLELPRQAGRFVEVAGGLVFVQREEAPRPISGEPIRTPAKPSPPPALPVTAAWSNTGGMGLRSELFAAQTVAQSTLPGHVGLRSAPSPLPPAAREPESADAGAAAPQWGFAGAGGLVYLHPSTLAEPSSLRARGEVSGRGGSAPAPRPSILDLAATGLRNLFPFSFLPPAAEPAAPAAPPRTIADGVSSPLVTALPAFDTEPQDFEGEEPPGRRIYSGGLPMLSLEALPAPAAGRATGSVTGLKAAQGASPGPAFVAGAQDLGARYAAPMLQSFPQGGIDAVAGVETPRLLWPQAVLETGERLQRLLAQLPTDWQPPPAVAAALDAGGVAGMPFWQRIAAQKPRVEEPAPGTAGPFVEPGLVPGEERGVDSGEEGGPQPARRGPLTLLRGEKPPPPPKVVAPSAEPSLGSRAPEIELITSALVQSGASKGEVEASVKLMEAIRSHAAGKPGKSDSRLDLGDLTMIAISMGQGRMAAALGTSVSTAIQNTVQSVEGALGLSPALRPEVPQDVNEILKKSGHLIKMVVKLVKGMNDKESLRDGQGG